MRNLDAARLENGPSEMWGHAGWFRNAHENLRWEACRPTLSLFEWASVHTNEASMSLTLLSPLIRFKQIVRSSLLSGWQATHCFGGLSHLPHARQFCIGHCFGMPSVMSTRVLMQFAHILAWGKPRFSARPFRAAQGRGGNGRTQRVVGSSEEGVSCLSPGSTPLVRRTCNTGSWELSPGSSAAPPHSCRRGPDERPHPSRPSRSSYRILPQVQIPGLHCLPPPLHLPQQMSNQPPVAKRAKEVQTPQ